MESSTHFGSWVPSRTTLDRARGLSVLDRVADEVRQDLTEPVAIPRTDRVPVRGEPQDRSRARGPAFFDGVSRELREIHSVTIERDSLLPSRARVKSSS